MEPGRLFLDNIWNKKFELVRFSHTISILDQNSNFCQKLLIFNKNFFLIFMFKILAQI